MASRRSEYEVEDMFIERLEGIGYQFIKMSNYDDVLNNFRTQLAKFNAKKLEEAGHTAAFSDAEFQRILIHVENHSVYESAQILRDKAVIRKGINTALKNTGNKPFFLDKAIHSENIYNVMLENIHNCKFLVADLTTQNLGVYYEAGYAKALGKTVIFTCKDSDLKNIHFDIKQVQTIGWKDESELSEELAKQICGLSLGKR